eukprot:NODE_7794_length_547_cov_9.473896_g6761_i0.p2 GENE.NODE_7794_length_547_cov_9.473896_g6761_i0~~NODE_7794_length_547_cov_9.473896_g6761_i0.p2  ORF type:complete len:71 (-),score=2.80 NODE_7794_length_547_cov_9.473896_g6761_i0:11-223(-)
MHTRPPAGARKAPAGLPGRPEGGQGLLASRSWPGPCQAKGWQAAGQAFGLRLQAVKQGRFRPFLSPSAKR